MRASLIALLVSVAAPAAAAAPLALAERQVVHLEFQRPVVRIATTAPELLHVQVTGARVSIAALRGGRATLELAFADGATIAYDVTVEAAQAPVARPARPDEIVLAVGEESRFRAPGVAQVLVEENGVARVAVEGETVSVVAVTSGESSVVLVDRAGAKTTRPIRVR